MEGAFGWQVMQKVDEALGLYHRLTQISDPAKCGKTPALQSVSASIATQPVNINLELSHRILSLTKRQRTLQMPILLVEIISDAPSKLILLDNIEMCFDPELKQNPLRLLQKLPRNKTIMATWNGSIVVDHVTYVIPDHPRILPLSELRFSVNRCTDDRVG